MEISIQYHVMLIRQSNDHLSMRCYIILSVLQADYSENFVEKAQLDRMKLDLEAKVKSFFIVCKDAFPVFILRFW
jgi:hypothetical protein